jgi:hypothetical protein
VLNFDVLIRDHDIDFYTKPMNRDELWGREYRRKIYEEEANAKRMAAEQVRHGSPVPAVCQRLCFGNHLKSVPHAC